MGVISYGPCPNFTRFQCYGCCMKRFVAVVVIIALCVGLIWVRGETAQARTQLGQGISTCATPTKGTEAIAACTDLLAREGLEPRARGVLYYHIGNAEMQMNKFEPALASLDKAAKLVPAEPMAHVARSSALIGLGQHGRSIKQAHAALDRWPAMPKPLQSEALRNIALGHQALGQPQEQLSALDEYIEAFPQDPVGLRHRARLLAVYGEKLGRPDKLYVQLMDLNQIIRLEPDHWEAYRDRAELLDRMGLTSVAKHEAARALKMELNFGNDGAPIEGAHRDIVERRYLLALAEHAASVKALSALTNEFALDARALELRARAHFMQGRMAAAIADMEALRKLRPDAKLDAELARFRRMQAALDGTQLLAG